LAAEAKPRELDWCCWLSIHLDLIDMNQSRQKIVAEFTNRFVAEDETNL